MCVDSHGEGKCHADGCNVDINRLRVLTETETYPSELNFSTINKYLIYIFRYVKRQTDDPPDGKYIFTTPQIELPAVEHMILNFL